MTRHLIEKNVEPPDQDESQERGHTISAPDATSLQSTEKTSTEERVVNGKYKYSKQQ